MTTPKHLESYNILDTTFLASLRFEARPGDVISFELLAFVSKVINESTIANVLVSARSGPAEVVENA